MNPFNSQKFRQVDHLYYRTNALHYHQKTSFTMDQSIALIFPSRRPYISFLKKCNLYFEYLYSSGILRSYYDHYLSFLSCRRYLYYRARLRPRAPLSGHQPPAPRPGPPLYSERDPASGRAPLHSIGTYATPEGVRPPRIIRHMVSMLPTTHLSGIRAVIRCKWLCAEF